MTRKHFTTLRATVLLTLFASLSAGCRDDPYPRRWRDAAPDLGGDAGSDTTDARAEAAVDAPKVRPDQVLPTVEVQTTKGPVLGQQHPDLAVFLGIPYVAPPIGDLRWKPPTPHAGWTAPRQALAAGPSCEQPGLPIGVPPGNISEDCLTLNIWTPSTTPDTGAPVLVWIHGGGFVSGSSAETVYDGTKLVRRGGNVLVSFNYRLGPLGFLTLPGKTGTSNLGLEDQQAALRWIRDNIGKFGGDPSNITIMGESAGGVSTCAHLLSPGSAGLFHRAIMQSGPCPNAFAKREELEQSGLQLAAALGCGTAADALTCMRKKPANEVAKILPLKEAMIWGPGPRWVLSVDGVVIPGQPAEQFAQGRFNRVPVILGTNENEGTIFLLLAGRLTVDKAGYEESVLSLFDKDLGKEILDRYKFEDFAGGFEAVTAVINDLGFQCPAQKMARALRDQGVAVHLYRFTHVPSFAPFPQMGSYHTADLPFTFGNFDSPATPGEVRLSEIMMDLWSSYAAQRPLKADTLPWPRYDGSESFLQLGESRSIVKTPFATSHCTLWDTVKLSVP